MMIWWNKIRWWFRTVGPKRLTIVSLGQDRFAVSDSGWRNASSYTCAVLTREGLKEMAQLCLSLPSGSEYLPVIVRGTFVESALLRGDADAMRALFVTKAHPPTVFFIDAVTIRRERRLLEHLASTL